MFRKKKRYVECGIKYRAVLEGGGCENRYRTARSNDNKVFDFVFLLVLVLSCCSEKRSTMQIFDILPFNTVEEQKSRKERRRLITGSLFGTRSITGGSCNAGVVVRKFSVSGGLACAIR